VITSPFRAIFRGGAAAVATETSVFEARARKLPDIDVLVQQETRLTEALKLLSREIELTRRLFVQKVVPKSRCCGLSAKQARCVGNCWNHSRRYKIPNYVPSQADEDLAKSRGDLAVLDENIKSAQTDAPHRLRHHSMDH